VNPLIEVECALERGMLLPLVSYLLPSILDLLLNVLLCLPLSPNANPAYLRTNLLLFAQSGSIGAYLLFYPLHPADHIFDAGEARFDLVLAVWH